MSEPVGELEESPGVLSWMRKNARIAIYTGVGLTVAGVLMAAAILVTKRWEAVALATAEIAGGPSLIAVALGAKAWQAQAESRVTVATTAGGPPSPPPGA